MDQPTQSGNYQVAQLSPSICFRLAFGPAYGLSDVGLVRSANEDNFLIDPALGLVAVADGMGGHGGGEIASHLALSALREALRAAGEEVRAGAGAAIDGLVDPDATWQDQHMSAVLAAHAAVERANARVHDANLAQGSSEGAGMGTTLTGFWQCQPGGALIVFHVGDSRLYRCRDGELALLTRDQTLYQQALEAGASDNLPPRNLLLQAIGPTAAVAPDVEAHVPRPGDLYLLCSDGLYGTTPHAAIAQALAHADAQSLDACCAALIALAKQHGGRDNITAVLALVDNAMA
jgi:serine/threonine protein phosphatase PrpC